MEGKSRPNRPCPDIDQSRVYAKHLRIHQLESHPQHSTPIREVLFPPRLDLVVQMRNRKVKRQIQYSRLLIERARLNEHVDQANAINELFEQWRHHQILKAQNVKLVLIGDHTLDHLVDLAYVQN